MQPICDWTTANVIEWMAAIGLHHHTDVFKSKAIKGSELIHLNRDKLVVSDSFLHNSHNACWDIANKSQQALY